MKCISLLCFNTLLIFSLLQDVVVCAATERKSSVSCCRDPGSTPQVRSIGDGFPDLVARNARALCMILNVWHETASWQRMLGFGTRSCWESNQGRKQDSDSNRRDVVFAIILCWWKRVVKITLPRFAVSYLFCAVDRRTTNTRCFVLGVYSVFQR